MVQAFHATLRRNPATSPSGRGPNLRERIVLASDASIAARKVQRDARRNSSWMGWQVAEIRLLPEVVK